MLEGWQVPEHPEQAEVTRSRRRRLILAWIGAAAGFLANLALVLLSFGLSADTAIAGFWVIFATVILSGVLLLTGGLLCIGRPVRPLGIGLLIGTGAGLIASNGLCFAILAAAG